MTIDEAIEELDRAEAGTRFSRLLAICEEIFGAYRKRGSHRIFSVPWRGDPRINLQSEKGKAKAYQVRQVLAALRKLKSMKGADYGKG